MRVGIIKLQRTKIEALNRNHHLPSSLLRFPLFRCMSQDAVVRVHNFPRPKGGEGRWKDLRDHTDVAVCVRSESPLRPTEPQRQGLGQ